MSLNIERLSYALGGEITGVDLTKSIDDATFAQIYSAFLKYNVILFRGQTLNREQHVAFSRRFGELDKNEIKPATKKVPEHPEITFVVSRPKPTGEAATGRYSGQEWHSDRSHLPIAAQASLLRGVEVPEVGGDTMFANMYLAYESLSDGMKKLLEGLDGVHVEGIAHIDNSTPERAAESRRLIAAAAHPIVRVHPDTGRKALYVCELVKIIVGMTAEESKPLVQYLTNHAVRPQHIYRHRWKKNDLLIWDNRCLLHIALADYDRSQVRHMERTTVNGTLSGYVYDGPLG